MRLAVVGYRQLDSTEFEGSPVASEKSAMEMRVLCLWRPVINACVHSCAVLCAAAAVSGELLELSATEVDNEYRLHVVAVLAAREADVYRVITDYRHAYRINPAITEIDILSSHRDDVTRVRHRSVHRVGLFAFELEWTGDIVADEDGRVDITTVPEMSSFESGSATWEIRPQGERTWVRHESRLKPKFFVVPVIGDYLVKRHLKQEALTTFTRIECHAQRLLEMDAQEAPESSARLPERDTDCGEIVAAKGNGQ